VLGGVWLLYSASRAHASRLAPSTSDT
jgi:hypothetical protein